MEEEDDDRRNVITQVENSPSECCIFSTTGNTSSNDMISFPPSSPIFASRAAKSDSSFSNIDVMAGVSCDGSMIENLGRPVHSRRGLVDNTVGGVAAAAASAVDDMARAVVVAVADAAAAAVEGQAEEEKEEEARWARPFLTSAAAAAAAAVVDEWRRTFAAFEKARMGEALREASKVKASAMGDTFIICDR